MTAYYHPTADRELRAIRQSNPRLFAKMDEHLELASLNTPERWPRVGQSTQVAVVCAYGELAGRQDDIVIANAPGSHSAAFVGAIEFSNYWIVIGQIVVNAVVIRRASMVHVETKPLATVMLRCVSMDVVDATQIGNLVNQELTQLTNCPIWWEPST